MRGPGALGAWGPGQALIWGGVHVVRSARDLPEPVGGIITLPADTAWMICAHVDLAGARIECTGTTTIYGTGQETASLTSTGLTGQPLVKAYATLALRTLSFVMPSGEICIDVDGDATTALDWQYINFTGGARAATISTINNFVGEGLAVLDGTGFLFEGAAQSIVFNNSIFVPSVGGAGVSFEPAATISRRMRLTNCALVINAGASGVVFNGPTIVSPEGFILDGCNFSGAGTYLTGITYLSDLARFTECRGIVNSTRIGAYAWTANATPTEIAATDTYVKAAGTSTAKPINQRFTHSSNRLTYASALQQAFVVGITATVTSGNGHQVTLALYKNGVIVPESAQTVTTNAAGRAENVSLQEALELAAGDYIEVWCANGTSITDIVVVDLNVIARVVS